MRPEKQSIAAELTEHLSESEFCILTDYMGLTVDKTQELRNKLHETSARMTVVRNRVMSLVAKEQGLEGLEPGLSGPTAMVFGSGDVVGTAKVLKEFVKNNELPVVKIGALDGQILTAEQINELASLPSREELLAKVVGTIAAPLSQVVGVLNQKVSSLVHVLNAVKVKKEEEG